jgi:hypothetical protein
MGVSGVVDRAPEFMIALCVFCDKAKKLSIRFAGQKCTFEQ